MYSLHTSKVPEATGAFSQGASAARFVFVSSQLPVDPVDFELTSPDLFEQTLTCLRYIRAILASSDLNLDDIVKVTIYVTDYVDLAIIDEVFDQTLSSPYPARSVVLVPSLPRGARVSIDAVAVR